MRAIVPLAHKSHTRLDETNDLFKVVIRRDFKQTENSTICTVKKVAGAPDAYQNLSGNQSGSIWIFVHPQISLHLDQFPVLSGKYYSFFERVIPLRRAQKVI